MEEISVRGVLAGHLNNPEVLGCPAIKFEDETWTYQEFITESIVWAQALKKLHDPKKHFHIGVLLDNGPSYCFALGSAAFLGAVVVGINPTRRGAELSRDIAHTDCELILTESRYKDLLLDIEGLSAEQVFCVDESSWTKKLQPYRSDPQMPDEPIDPSKPYLFLFTSGTTGAPKAAICSQDRFARIGHILTETYQLTTKDVCYQVMPMFHSNGLMAGWIPCVVSGATGVFRRKFSASSWLDDVRKFQATYFNYVGKPLTYILATPETANDKDHKLRVVFGNEGAVHDLNRFEERFGVSAFDSYGSTEGGLAITRGEETPPAALGKGDEFTKILDPETQEECPLAEFDETGKLLNPDSAIGEMVHLKSQAMFEGYWNNPEANNERTHGNKYWSGDLGYMDAEGFIYFAGRNYDWLRVDGENFAAAPVERILVRHSDIDLAAVYAVPNSDVGDDVMAAVVRRSGAGFKPEEFFDFLKSQPDMGTKWIPKYVRWSDDLPKTPSMKILKRVLRNEFWETEDEVWIRDGEIYKPLTEADKKEIRKSFAARGRESLI